MATSSEGEGGRREQGPSDLDAWLVKQLRSGDDAAAEELVRRHGPALLPVARRILGGDEHEAQDALQDALIQAFRNIDRFDGRARLSTWLYRIVVNAALLRIRRRSRRPGEVTAGSTGVPLDLGAPPAPRKPWPTAEQLVERQELRDLVLAGIAELPEDSRNIILLRDIEGLNTREAAESLGISPGNAKVRLHRARTALRELLDPRICAHEDGCEEGTKSPRESGASVPRSTGGSS